MYREYTDIIISNNSRDNIQLRYSSHESIFFFSNEQQTVEVMYVYRCVYR